MKTTLPLALISFVAFLLALSLHEAAHAWVAWRRGDDTARRLGRITLNPLRHIDLFGTVVLPLLLLVSGSSLFIGWAKPTPVDPRRFRNPQWDGILVSLAGPASNVALAAVAMVALRLLAWSQPAAWHLAFAHLGQPQAGDSLWIPVVNFAYMSVALNLLLAIFNLIPLPPLDGSHVLRYLLPAAPRRWFEKLYGNGFASLALLVLILYAGVPDRVFSPVLDWVTRLAAPH